MKPEEPQEEQEKELPGWAYKIPFFLSKYGTHLLFAVALVLLAYNLYNWYQRKQEEKVNNAWSQLADAGSPQASDPPAKLTNIVNTYDMKPVQALAYVSLGDFYAETVLLGNPPEGVRGVKVTKDAAEQKALDAYERVLADYADQPLAVARARLGLGKVYEDQGQWDKAQAEYEKLVAAGSGTNSDFAELAKSRIDHLKEWRAPIVVGAALHPSESATSGPTIEAPTRPATATPAATSPAPAATMPTTQK